MLKKIGLGILVVIGGVFIFAMYAYMLMFVAIILSYPTAEAIDRTFGKVYAFTNTSDSQLTVHYVLQERATQDLSVLGPIHLVPDAKYQARFRETKVLCMAFEGPEIPRESYAVWEYVESSGGGPGPYKVTFDSFKNLTWLENCDRELDTIETKIEPYAKRY